MNGPSRRALGLAITRLAELVVIVNHWSDFPLPFDENEGWPIPRGIHP